MLLVQNPLDHPLHQYGGLAAACRRVYQHRASSGLDGVQLLWGKLYRRFWGGRGIWLHGITPFRLMLILFGVVLGREHREKTGIFIFVPCV